MVRLEDLQKALDNIEINSSYAELHANIENFRKLFSAFSAKQQALARDNTNIHFLYEQAQSENDGLVACCEKMKALRELWKKRPKFGFGHVSQEECEEWFEKADKVFDEGTFFEKERPLRKLLNDALDELVIFVPSTEKLEVYDKETKETWIVTTAKPEQWSMFLDCLDSWLVKMRRACADSKRENHV